MQGEPVSSGIVLIGTDPVAVDSVAATMMGFDWRKIPMIREAFNLSNFPITRLQHEEIVVRSDVAKWNGFLSEIESQVDLCFKPHFGWSGHIERRVRH
jgi:uncharacterized protein (DUF362 family)